VQATWGTRREKLESGNAWNFQKPREVLTPQAPNTIVVRLIAKQLWRLEMNTILLVVWFLCGLIVLAQLVYHYSEFYGNEAHWKSMFLVLLLGFSVFVGNVIYIDFFGGTSQIDWLLNGYSQQKTVTQEFKLLSGSIALGLVTLYSIFIRREDIDFSDFDGGSLVSFIFWAISLLSSILGIISFFIEYIRP